MKIFFVQTGKTTENYVNEGTLLYTERIKRYTPFELVTLPGLKSTKGLSPDDVKKREGQQQLEYVDKNSYLILLDEHGKEFTTLELASFISHSLTNLRKNIVFLSGGAWGFSPDVHKRGDMKLSLSRLTFPHQLVRILFLEQIYRALTVIEGDPYHHE